MVQLVWAYKTLYFLTRLCYARQWLDEERAVSPLLLISIVSVLVLSPATCLCSCQILGIPAFIVIDKATKHLGNDNYSEKKKFESLIKGSEPLFISSDKKYSIVAFPDNKTGTGRLNATDKSDSKIISQANIHTSDVCTKPVFSVAGGTERTTSTLLFSGFAAFLMDLLYCFHLLSA